MQSWIAGAVRHGGVEIRDAAGVADGRMGAYLQHTLGLDPVMWRDGPGAEGTFRYALVPEAAAALVPSGDTLHLARHLHPAGLRDARSLEREIAVALLSSPTGETFASVEAFASQVRVLRRIAEAAAQAAVAFNTEAAERPAAYWHYDEEAGFLLNADVGLVDALRAATLPSVTGALYDFSCYRASEYVLLLGMSEELALVDTPLLEQLERRSRRRAIRSREFHEVFLEEFGTLERPVAPRYFIPGDRVWFRNPDERSSDVMGYEGSWVIYLGGGLFSNFWKAGHPYTLEAKCLEIFHWRDGAYQDDRGVWHMDESVVEAEMAQTRCQPDRHQAIMARMLRTRDPQGVYAAGGCLDATRERPRSVWPGERGLQFAPE